MRSRLEAACAAWLDRNGFTWAYEPQVLADDTGQWLPDFALENVLAVKGNPKLYIDVKPADYDEEALRDKMAVTWASEPTAALAVWAIPHFVDGDGGSPSPSGMVRDWGPGRSLAWDGAQAAAR